MKLTTLHTKHENVEQELFCNVPLLHSARDTSVLSAHECTKFFIMCFSQLYRMSEYMCGLKWSSLFSVWRGAYDKQNTVLLCVKQVVPHIAVMHFQKKTMLIVPFRMWNQLKLKWLFRWPLISYRTKLKFYNYNPLYCTHLVLALSWGCKVV